MLSVVALVGCLLMASTPGAAATRATNNHHDVSAIADPNAAIMWNVIKDWQYKDDTWSPTTALSSWAGVTVVAGLFHFTPTSTNRWRNVGSGPVNLAMPSTFPLGSLNFHGLQLQGGVDLSTLPQSLERLILSSNSQLGGTLDLGHLSPNLAWLDVSGCSFTGEVPGLDALTSSLTYLDISDNGALTGHINWAALPRGLTTFNVNINQFIGEVDIASLPPALAVATFSSNNFTGALDLTKLPANAALYSFSINRFTGSLDFSSLPSGFEALIFNHNQFSGSLDLTQLPSPLTAVYLSWNQFSGSLDATKLPSGIQYFHLEYNQFSGSLDLRTLPAALLSIELGANQFTGPLYLSTLPSGLQTLDASNNSFSGPIDVTRLPATLWSLELYFNQLSGTLDTSTLPAAMSWLDFSYNQFTGGIDLSNVPPALQSLYLMHNHFSGRLDLNHLYPPGQQQIQIDARGNHFTGVINIYQNGYQWIGDISCNDNDFYGVVDFSNSQGSLVSVFNTKVSMVICPIDVDAECYSTWNTSVQVLNSTAPNVTVPFGRYIHKSSTTGRSVTINIANATTSVDDGKCKTWGGLQYGFPWGYIGESPAWLEHLTPCLPLLAAGRYYLYAKLSGTSVLVVVTGGDELAFHFVSS